MSRQQRTILFWFRSVSRSRFGNYWHNFTNDYNALGNELERRDSRGQFFRRICWVPPKPVTEIYFPGYFPSRVVWIAVQINPITSMWFTALCYHTLVWSNLDVIKFVFNNRTADNRNCLSDNCVSCTTLDNFKTQMCLNSTENQIVLWVNC